MKKKLHNSTLPFHILEKEKKKEIQTTQALRQRGDEVSAGADRRHTNASSRAEKESEERNMSSKYGSLMDEFAQWGTNIKYVARELSERTNDSRKKKR